MDSEIKNCPCPYIRKGPDWRNTVYEFITKAVIKYKLKPHDIAVFFALFASAKRNGTMSIGNNDLMARSGISDYRSFKKARDKLAQFNIITILKKGGHSKESTVYKIKLVGKPPKKEANIET